MRALTLKDIHRARVLFPGRVSAALTGNILLIALNIELFDFV
jgi:hypothetical protein